jgi:hypothetical protein
MVGHYRADRGGGFGRNFRGELRGGRCSGCRVYSRGSRNQGLGFGV